MEIWGIEDIFAPLVHPNGLGNTLAQGAVPVSA